MFEVFILDREIFRYDTHSLICFFGLLKDIDVEQFGRLGLCLPQMLNPILRELHKAPDMLEYLREGIGEIGLSHDLYHLEQAGISLELDLVGK